MAECEKALHHGGTEEKRKDNSAPLPHFLRGCAFLLILLALLSKGGLSAQAPKPAPKLDANLLQLMRGTLYPASNVLFAAQEDLSKQPKVAEADQATSPNPLTSTYGGWVAVENA